MPAKNVDHIANEKAEEAKRITAKLSIVLYEYFPKMSDTKLEHVEQEFAKILRGVL